MNRSWFIFYGLQIGLSRQEIMTTRVGEMLDLISCLSIYNGGSKLKKERKRMTYEEVMAMK